MCPFHTFINSLTHAHTHTHTHAHTHIQWSDTRFNNRYTNGFILDWKGAGVTQESTEWSYIDWPYWNFVEVSPITDKPGYYHNLYRRRVVSNESAQDRAYEQTNKQAAIAEQAAVWSAVELCDAPHALGQGCCGAGRPLPCRAVGGWSWDGWSNTTDGLTTLERYASSSIDKGLQYVTMNRWNYAVGWCVQTPLIQIKNQEPSTPFLINHALFDCSLAGMISRKRGSPELRPHSSNRVKKEGLPCTTLQRTLLTC